MKIIRTLPSQGNAAALQKAQVTTQATPQKSQESDEKKSDVFEMAASGGLVGAAVLGVPAAAGAALNGLSGGGKALVAFASPVVAAVGLGAYAGYATHKSTKGHPVLTGMASLAGAAVGGVGTQVGVIPGLAWGWKGALGAAVMGAAVVGGMTAYAAHQTRDF